jgi:hypothetical protein
MSKYSDNDLLEAHRLSFNNMSELKVIQKCGCFYCTEIFMSDEIVDHIDDEPYGTAICPYCAIDSVIGQSSGYPITEDFLLSMKRYWFDSGYGEAFHTPFGIIQILIDNTIESFHHRSIAINEQLFPNVDAAHRINIKVENDGKSHTIRIRLMNCDVGGNVESGETLEAISFYKNNGKITIGCYASFGDSAAYNLGYDGFYHSDGIQINIPPTTQTQEYKFGICWIKECTDKNDIQTWFGADPSI